MMNDDLGPIGKCNHNVPFDRPCDACDAELDARLDACDEAFWQFCRRAGVVLICLLVVYLAIGDLR